MILLEIIRPKQMYSRCWEMSWLLKSLLAHNFCSKLCCCHLIDLRACAPGVKLPSLSRDLTGLYMWGHSPSNAKRCKPLLFFPARWLFELWRFNDYVWADGVKSRNNILITSKDGTSLGSLVIIIFLQKTSGSIILSWENDLMLIIMATYYYLDTYKLNVMKNME